MRNAHKGRGSGGGESGEGWASTGAVRGDRSGTSHRRKTGVGKKKLKQETRMTRDITCDERNGDSPGPDDLEVVLHSLVVDESPLLEVAHLDLLVTDPRLDSGHRSLGHDRGT